MARSFNVDQGKNPSALSPRTFQGDLCRTAGCAGRTAGRSVQGKPIDPERVIPVPEEVLQTLRRPPQETARRSGRLVVEIAGVVTVVLLLIAVAFVGRSAPTEPGAWHGQ